MPATATTTTEQSPPVGPVLAFDCAGSACSAAVVAGERVLAYLLEERRRGQAERLLPLLQAVLREAGLDWPELARLAVTRGPGSFTGVRIGLATARALALAAGRPLIALDRFAVYAAMAGNAQPSPAHAERRLAVLIDARREDLFLQCFDAQLRAMGEPEALLASDLSERLGSDAWILAGDGVAQALPLLAGRKIDVAPQSAHCDARVLACLAVHSAVPQEPDAQGPLYLRPPDVTLPSARNA